ncbi:serine carboxypeptidase-like 51 [Carex littledalei]|uniref:Carboxypeptidase n=1 Tax=Carex littledalei TaxID=544730 RepID=A0A833R9Y0_9POAL|nr:serine carboxypeptidase-like 51 [Carex littledalei]
MVKFYCCLSLSFLILSLLLNDFSNAAGTADKSEEWGYVQVRPKAHMFWWLYRSPRRTENSLNTWPTILWLQGGPGASGVALGNFMEIGPLDLDLNARPSTWLKKADLLFVDNPVGTGYSFVEDTKLLVKSDEEAAKDLTTLLQKLCNKNTELQRSPLFIVAESYGGKFAVTAGLSIVKAVNAKTLNLKFGGVALGDSWISPEDFVLSWGPLLLDMSRLDKKDAEKSNSLAIRIKDQLKNGQYKEAEQKWDELEDVVRTSSNYVDFYNFLNEDLPSQPTTDMKLLEPVRRRYFNYITSKASSTRDTDDLMNTVIRRKLRIIPKNISWGGQSDDVFEALKPDFMRPRINEVDELLSLGVNVTVYNGQLDLICSTKGTEAWIQKLRWKGLKSFMESKREPLYCEESESGSTKAFKKSYKNLHLYWILGAGHFVPVDQPCIALQMVTGITHSSA